MRFEWDDAKAGANLSKHAVSFALAQEIWNDPFHVILPDRFVDGEQRWHAIGVVGVVTLLVAVHVYPAGDDSHVRIIGARRATTHERKRYEEDRT